MRSDHDFDATFLLAISLAAKRRPADLAEIVTAFNLVSDNIPITAKFSEAFYRLSQYGLLIEQDGGYTLTPYALNIVSGHKKSATYEARILAIKQSLAECRIKKEIAPIELKLEQIALAVRAHRASLSAPVKNISLKPKQPEGTDKRLARRKSNQAFAARQRKA
jgi:hypothetical protein